MAILKPETSGKHSEKLAESENTNKLLKTKRILSTKI